MLKPLLVVVDSLLVFTGLKISPDASIVKSYGAKYFISVAIKVFLSWIFIQSISKSWSLADRVVVLESARIEQNNNVSMLLNSNEYLINANKALAKEKCNDRKNNTKDNKAKKNKKAH